MLQLVAGVVMGTAIALEQAPGTPPVESEPRIHVRGRVVDTQGAPIENGEIELLQLDADPPPDEIERRPTGTKLMRKGGGRFELDVEGPCELTWTGPESHWSYSGTRRRTIVGALVQSREAAAEDYEIIVATLVGVSGTLVGKDGIPLDPLGIEQRVSDEWLAEVQGSSPARRRWQLDDGFRPGGLGPDGTFYFEFPSIPGSVLEIVTSDEVVASSPMPDKGVEDLRIVVPQDAVNGVLMRPSGTAIAGAQVKWNHMEAVSDARGRFKFESGEPVVSDSMLSIVERDGTDALFREFGKQWKARDAKQPFRILLEFTHAIRGELLDAAGKPAAGWLIVVTQSSAPVAPFTAGIQRQEYARATTDEKGAFVLQGLPVGEHELYLRSPDELIAFRATGVRGGRGDVVLRVPERAVVPVVRARVVTVSGEPIPNARVAFDVVYPSGYPHGPGMRSAKSDADGWLEVRDVSREATGVRVLDLEPRFMSIDWQPLALDADDKMTIRVSRAAVVRFERRRLDLDAKRIVLFDAQGQEMKCQARWKSGGEWNSAMSGPVWPAIGLTGDSTPEFVVGADAQYVGVFSKKGEMERFRIALTTDRLNRIAWR